MEILSFVLGMGAVLVIALAIVGVVALVKVLNLKKNYEDDIKNIYQQINNVENNFSKDVSDLYQNISTNINDVNHEIEKNISNIFRTMDSRFDGFLNKITKDAETSAKNN